MYRIIEITPSGGLLSILLEPVGAEGAPDKYVVAKEFFTPLSMNEGDAINDAELEELRGATVRTAAAQKALDALSYSSLSRRALTDKLRLKYKFGADDAEAAADYAVSRGFLDEEAQAARIAEMCASSKCWGKRRVVLELISKGYPKETALRAASSVGDGAYRDALDRLAKKKAPRRPADRAEENKIISSLMRYGHDASDIKAALRGRFKETD